MAARQPPRRIIATPVKLCSGITCRAFSTAGVKNEKASFKAALAQSRLWEDRKVTKEPPRKVPFKFQYVFECDDQRCKKNHRMMIEDWELGALYWRLVDRGATPQDVAKSVREKFLGTLCAPDRDTHFYVGTVLAHHTWVVIGVFWPKLAATKRQSADGPTLFD